MKASRAALNLSLALSFTTALSLESLAQAQITPDSTLGSEGSTVTPAALVQGELADLVEGGAIRGSNLFHSFLEFNINAGQRVYFANPSGVESILSRVTGANPSNIFGTLGVDGAADLFLINPNGLVFGETAALDIEGSFYAATAAAIPLGDGVYSATEPAQSSLLTVSPSALFSSYLTQASGDIENRGQLAVQGDLTLAANTLDLQGQVAAGGDLTLLGNAVQIRDAADTPFVGFAGGDLLVQGNEQVDIVALSHPDSGLYSYGDMVLRSANPVGGDAHYFSGGSFRVENLDESLGELFSPIDPVIRAQGDVAILLYRGGSLHILAGGSVAIGTAIITDADPGELGVDFLRETITLSDGTVVAIDGGAQPTLDVRAGVDPAVIGLIPPGNVTGLDPTFRLLGLNVTNEPTRADITVGDVLMGAPNGLVLLTTQYQPNSQITGGNILIESQFTPITGSIEELIARNIIISFLGFDERPELAIFNGFNGIAAGTFGGGEVVLDARNDISIIDTLITTYSSTEDPGGDITLLAGETLRLDNPNGRITTVITGTPPTAISKGGDIRVVANDLEMANGTQLSTLTLGPGDAGQITIAIRETASLGVGEFGQLDGSTTSIITEVLTGAVGNGGDIVLSASNLEVANGARLSASTFGRGDAGNVILTIGETARFDDTTISSAVFQSAVGNGGDIVLSASNLEVTNGAQLSASTFGRGDAGNVILTIGETARFEGTTISSAVFPSAVGNGGNIEIMADTLEVTNGGQIETATLGKGSAGDVVIQSGVRVILEGTSSSGLTSNINSASISFTEEGGDIRITTPDLKVENGASLLASTLNTQPGGDIVLFVNRLSIINGGQVIADSLGSGPAGSIRIDATDSILISGNDPTFAVRESQNPGLGLIFIPQSLLSVRSRATGTAGNIIIGELGTTPQLELNNEGQIIAESASVDGGNIVITLNNLLLMRNGSLISTTAGTNQAGGNGGNITISVPFIIAIPTEDSDIAADAFEGAGGNVSITARGIFGIEPRPQRTGLSDITASSEIGVSGVVTLNTLDTSAIENSLTSLADTIVDTSSLTAGSCIARTSDDSLGSFVATGSGGLPQGPGDSTLSTYPTGTVRAEAAPTAAVQEPDGVYQLSDGRLVLSRTCE